jgi:serine/threonine protein kinase
MDNKQNYNKILGSHMINQIFFNKYKLTEKLGEGSFGMIFKADGPNGKVAFKFEKKRPNKRSLLKNESQVMIYLKGKGIPSIELYTEEEDYNIMIMQLLGKSLEGLLKHTKNKRFSAKTIGLLGFEIVPILKFIHDKHVIHRDIKPDNFAIGYDDPCQIYILDFGLAKKYRSSKTLKQTPMIRHTRLTGTARYASINALRGYEQSRRDDMESLGYVLAYLIRGSLPWQGMAAKTKEEKYAKILNKKISVSTEKLLKNEPQELIDYIKYCRLLKYEQEPDYEYMMGLFKNIVKKDGVGIDYKFDWVNDDDIEIHKKYINESFGDNKLENTSLINNMNSLTLGNSKNNISIEDNEKINNKEENEIIQVKEKEKNKEKDNDNDKTDKEEKVNYYDEVIDEILLDKNEKDKKNIENEEEEENIGKNKRKHGQCCTII